jgi:type I restriction enzyme S subunit
MEYKRYPTYKDSGVEWLTEIPGHWDESIVSALFEDNKRKNKGTAEQNLLSLSYGRIINKDINTEEGLLPASFVTYQIVEPDYIVLRLTDLQNDQRSLRVGQVRERGIITSAYTALKKKSFRMSSARYFYYLLHAYDLMKVFYGMGAGVRQSLGYDELKKIRLLLPAEGEQQSIVQFLDRETTRIDALIEKKQRLIELLKEKRQAVITQAVTKGLDPNVPMKDSGVEWLGEVPEHWVKAKTKHIVTESIQMGPFGASLKELSQEATGYKLYGQENYISGDFNKGSRWVTEELFGQLKKYQLLPGDIVFTRKGSIGNCRVVPIGIIPGMIDSDSIRVRLDESLIRKKFFVILSHESWYVSQQLEVGKRGAILSGLNTGNIANLFVFVPPLEEQKCILNFLTAGVQKLDEVIDKTECSINLLKEHRSALITAAVTGQIDVRNLA